MNNIEHADIASQKDKTSSGNPITNSLNLVVSVPESINIRMVDATSLTDYEIWFFITSILANALTGFLVAFIQILESDNSNSRSLGWMTFVFGILFFVSLVTTFCKRHEVKKKGRDIKLKTSSDNGE